MHNRLINNLNTDEDLKVVDCVFYSVWVQRGSESMNSRNQSELLQKSVRWSKRAKSNAGSLFSVTDECISKESAGPLMLQSAECSLNRTKQAKMQQKSYSTREERSCVRFGMNSIVENIWEIQE